MDGVFRTLGLMLGLILVYLLVVHSGGAAQVLGQQGIGGVLTSETTALQGR